MQENDSARRQIGPERLNAFSDGVLAIIITIMVLELKVPETPGVEALLAQWPLFSSYALSYLMVAIYWVNHHDLFNQVEQVTDGMVWCNLLLLFFLSLIPFTTGYMSVHHLEPLPTVIYATSLLLPALAYLFLMKVIRSSGVTSQAHVGPAAHVKALVSLAFYAAAIPVAWVSPVTAILCIAAVGLMWLLPGRWTRRLERDSAKGG